MMNTSEAATKKPPKLSIESPTAKTTEHVLSSKDNGMTSLLFSDRDGETALIM